MNKFTGIGMTSQRTRERLAKRLSDEGITNSEILEAILATPRHLFIDEALSHRAYEDSALPIGFGQTISQPYVVARMTEQLISTGSVDRVLEVGTGSGYQTAILSHFAKEIFTIERVKALYEQARDRFRQLNLYQIKTRYGDGFKGWPEHAPYDAIIVTAAPKDEPKALLEQLAIDGRMIIPMGDQEKQRLHLITRVAESKYERTPLDWVRFVPLVSGKA